MKTIWNFISSFFVTVIVIAAVALLAAKVSGCSLFSIETGSMEPLYPVNALIVVQPVDFEEIEVGDVISYVLNEGGTVVTHRVTSIDSESGTLRTKGDANEIEDVSDVYYQNVVGRVIFRFPYIGAVFKVLSDEENKTKVIAVIAALLISSAAVDIASGIRRKKKLKMEVKNETL